MVFIILCSDILVSKRSNSKFTYFVFNLTKIKCYLKELNVYGLKDPHNIFPLITNKMINFLAPKLIKSLCGFLLLVVFKNHED